VREGVVEYVYEMCASLTLSAWYPVYVCVCGCGRTRARACVCVRVCVRPYTHAHVHACVCVCTRPFHCMRRSVWRGWALACKP
jgi:hypothetical protein